MKFNVTTEDAKFIVNKEKKTVVCVIENTQQLFDNFAISNFRIAIDCDLAYNFINNINKGESILAQKMIMPGKFVGVAHCGEDDEWDENIGRVIAFSRAKDSLITSFYKRAQTYTDCLTDWLNAAVDMMNEMGEKLETNKKKRHEYIESLVGIEPPEDA